MSNFVQILVKYLLISINDIFVNQNDDNTILSLDNSKYFLDSSKIHLNHIFYIQVSKFNFKINVLKHQASMFHF
jgi:hypothetical protein